MADLQEMSDELPELEGVAMEPADVAPVASNTFSAKDLSEDILGGVDFDFPAPPSAASAPKPLAAPKAPAPGGFKPPAALFGQSGGFGTSGLKAVPLTAAPKPLAVAAPAPVEAIFDSHELSAPAADAKEALRAALTSDANPVALPPDSARALFQLARTLIKKGIVSVDDLL